MKPKPPRTTEAEKKEWLRAWLRDRNLKGRLDRFHMAIMMRQAHAALYSPKTQWSDVQISMHRIMGRGWV